MTKESFTEQVLSLTDTLYGVARTYLRDPADCADAVQESILKAWAGRAGLRQERYFRTWAVRILINECRSMLKKQKRVIPVAQVPESPAPPPPGPEIYELVMALEEKYRAPLVLYHCEGYTVQEITQVLRLPKGTVLSRLRRGRQMLKREWLGQEVYCHE